MADEHETSQNHALQENARDYKSVDENSTELSVENQTESMNDEVIEPARLVSESSGEIDSSKYYMTTALSTRVGFYDPQPAITTARIPTIFRSTQNYSSYPIKRFYSSSTTPNNWRLRHFNDMQQSQSSPYHSTDYYSSSGPTAMIMMRDKWRNKSGCYFSCIQQARGLQTVVSKYDFSTNIQLCEPSKVVR